MKILINYKENKIDYKKINLSYKLLFSKNNLIQNKLKI